MSPLIYTNKKDIWSTILIYILLLIQLIGITIAFLKPINSVLLSTFLGFALLSILYLLNKKEYSNYSILDDTIEFYKDKDKLRKIILPIKDIEQVRFEDEFHTQFDFFKTASADRIYLYLRKDVKSKLLQKDKVILLVNDSTKKKKHLSKILKHFQQKDKAVYIKTNHKLLQKELALKNWNRP